MKRRILVAPLNWGLGHATRCIPIIHALLYYGFQPVIASDGDALMLLKKEFPDLDAITLPSYHVRYTQSSRLFRFQMLINLPKIISAMKAENRQTSQVISSHNISGIISDNRLGVRNKLVPSVFITHQLRVLSGNTTWLTTKAHQYIIKKFDLCWVPDRKGNLNLSGKLGHIKNSKIPTNYIGPISRLKFKITPATFDILILLSGPEPQRSCLEKILLSVFKDSEKKIIMVKGLVEANIQRQIFNRITVYNFMNSALLEHTINESNLVISRPGYTTIMDLAKLNKKAFFIPTPGQFEQEYLAQRLTKLRLVPSCKQKDFTLKKLNSVQHFKGLETLHHELDFKQLFGLFQGE